MSGESPVRGTARIAEDGSLDLNLKMEYVEMTPPPIGLVERPQANHERATHSPDFASVNWYGEIYSFRGKQRAIVAMLWDAMEQGYRWVGQDVLLQQADSDCGRLRDLFKCHPSWGTLIVQAVFYGGPIGGYGLADPPR